MFGLLAAGMFAPAVALAAAVGQIIFAAGDARLEGGAALAKGAQIEVGQTIVTGAGGHVHLRFVDDAFVAVRPNSQLSIDDYNFDAGNSSANRVKFTLKAGTGRLITGKAGQANKQGFRLNTPMAAIGVRGTDFVVQVQGELTRVTVQQGAIVMAPFGGGCEAAGSGTCGGGLARQLTAAQAGGFLEMRGTQAPRLIAPDEARGLRLERPSPEEPAAAGGRPSAEAPPAGFSGTRSVAWGRWSGASDFGANVPPGYEVIGRNEAFVLLRAIESNPAGNLGGGGGPSREPKATNEVRFSLAGVEAFAREGGNAYRAATVSDAYLSVNFDKATYSTGFNLQFDGATHALSSVGAVGATGRFLDDSAKSSMSISGALSNEGREAGYVFFGSLPDNIRTYGVTRWER